MASDLKIESNYYTTANVEFADSLLLSNMMSELADFDLQIYYPAHRLSTLVWSNRL